MSGYEHKKISPQPVWLIFPALGLIPAYMLASDRNTGIWKWLWISEFAEFFIFSVSVLLLRIGKKQFFEMMIATQIIQIFLWVLANAEDGVKNTNATYADLAISITSLYASGMHYRHHLTGPPLSVDEWDEEPREEPIF